MTIVGRLIIALAEMLGMVLNLLSILIVIRALISWVNPDPFNAIVQFLYRMTDPILNPIRRFLPMMAIDISPVIAFLLIRFVQSFFIAEMLRFGYQV